MNENHQIELFLLKCAPIRAELDAILATHDPDLVGEEAGRSADEIMKEYSAQMSVDLRRQAARMAEYYRIFYMLENFIRDFVSTVMSDAVGTDWWETDVPENIKDAARRSRERELNSGVRLRTH